MVDIGEEGEYFFVVEFKSPNILNTILSEKFVNNFYLLRDCALFDDLSNMVLSTQLKSPPIIKL